MKVKFCLDSSEGKLVVTKTLMLCKGCRIVGYPQEFYGFKQHIKTHTLIFSRKSNLDIKTLILFQKYLSINNIPYPSVAQTNSGLLN